MKRAHPLVSFAVAAAVAVVTAAVTSLHPSAGSRQDLSADSGQDPAAGSEPDQQEGSRFRSGVELINVTVTVTDDKGRFVSGLLRDDFSVYEDDQLQTISHFSNERVPVSLGIALDTSGSMTAEKMSSARGAIGRFFSDLLGQDDEIFLYRFADVPQLVRDWTRDRRDLSRALERLTVGGGTALYDAVADAVLLAEDGQNSKKALLVISDGNDNLSRTSLGDLRRLIRESEALVYAIGVDGRAAGPFIIGAPRLPVPMPPPFPIPGRVPRPQSPPVRGGSSERLNAGALRRITDDSGGRTEIVRDFRDLDGATARIADELSKQYSLGYASSGKKDGRWHAIRVKVQNRKLQVRARRGYVAN
ncbi:MAG: VWA domain-containing protein [Acidobacteria bacterium]|nr:VWA domain-containing protein [Acidobacteriota bacterium]